MKYLSVITILFISMVFATSSADAANSTTGFSKYEIVSVNDLHMGKDVKAIWTINYNNKEVPITVVKRKTVEGAEYVVQTNYFAVSYAVTVEGFGAKEVRQAWSEVPRKINEAVICKKELANQAVITPNKVDDERALELIASYLPDLINEGYKHILN